MAYYFFMGTLQLPVPPAKMSVQIHGKNKIVNLINEGEVNLLKTPGLTTVSFDVRLPNTRYPWANYDDSLENMAGNAAVGKALGSSNIFGFNKASHYLQQFERFEKEKTPFRFIVTRIGQSMNLLFSTNLLVTLEDYNIVEDKARDGFDVTVPVKLREYRPFGTKKATMTTDANGNQTLSVENTRDTTDKAIPNAVKVTTAASVFEAVKSAAGGTLDWRTVALNNAVENPIADVKGMTLKL